MSARSTLLRLLRPGIQVPLADACAFGGVAALVMHAMRTAELSPGAFPAGVALVAAASLVVLRLLFGRATDAHRARVHAFLWPPVIGALVGAAVERGMCLTRPEMDLSFLGVRLGGDAMEVVAVSVLSGLAGVLGTALLLPQVVVIERARSAPDDAAARLTRLANRLAAVTWAAALAIGAVASSVASRGEATTARALAIAAAAGLSGQAMRWWLAREPPVRLAALPYR